MYDLLTDWIGPALIAFAGLLLLQFGLRPKRVGPTPFCRKCRYNLSGLVEPRTSPRDRDPRLMSATNRCPECGTALVRRRVVFGERPRKRLRILGGLVLLFAGLIPLLLTGVATAVAYDWYKLRPTAWVLNDFEAADMSIAERAFTELDRRSRTNSLSAAQFDRFVAGSIATLQPDSPETRTVSESLKTGATNLLWDLLWAAQLSSAEQDLFLSRLYEFSLAVRPKARPGEFVPIRRTVSEPSSDRASSLRPTISVTALPNDVQSATTRASEQADRTESHDAQPVVEPVPDPPLPDEGFRRDSERPIRNFRARLSRPGHYRATAVLVVTWSNPAGSGNGATFGLHTIRSPHGTAGLSQVSHTSTVQADFEICDECGAKPSAKSRDFDATIIGGVRISEVYLSRSRGSWSYLPPEADVPWSAKFAFDREIEIPLAFDVFRIVDGHEKFAGQLCESPGDHDRASEITWFEPPGRWLTSVAFVLRPSQAAAESTLDIFEYWDGTLRFDPVAVTPWTVTSRPAPPSTNDENVVATEDVSR